MDWELKTFRDNIHGYITIYKAFVDSFVDSFIFQRLRNIEQTGMRVLYPSARHDRFIHSLGTFHLGKKAFNSFRNNISSYSSHKKYYHVFHRRSKLNDAIWDKYDMLFSIACLLHDCAHAPFSHSLEYIYNLNGRLRKNLLECKLSPDFMNDFTSCSPKEHEIMSSIVIIRKFYNNIEDMLVERFYTNKKTDDQIQEDIEFVIRCILGCKYEPTSHKKQLMNCFIKLLNSEQVDVDKLDYIIRDSKQSGIDSFMIDIDRLLNSLTIAEVTELKNHPINGIIDNAIIDAEFVGEVDIKVSGSFSAKDFNGIIGGYTDISGEGVFINTIENPEHARIFIGSSEYTKSDITPPDNKNTFSIKGNVKNICLQNSIIHANMRFDANVNTNKPNYFQITSANINGKMTGQFISAKILDKFEDTKESDVSIELAFHKSSLNVLENVVLARNYEYKWIYAHHKVVYYSNYLLKELTHMASQKMHRYIFNDVDDDEEQFLSKMMDINTFDEDEAHNADDRVILYRFLTSDNDIITLIKCAFLHNYKLKYHPIRGIEYDEYFNSLAEEFFKRKYRISLWKSFSEYNILFFNLLSDDKAELANYLKNNFSIKNRKYGTLPPIWQDYLASTFSMKDIIWVSGEVSLKSLDLDKTFVLLKDKPARLRDALLMEDSSFGNDQKAAHSLFYIYYKGAKLNRKSLNSVISYITKEYRGIVDTGASSPIKI